MSTLRRLTEIGEREQRNKVYGVVVGVVTNNVDPDGKYRVKVRFPWLPNGAESGGEESHWCRIATPMAGKDRGMFMLPEPDDEVLVAFQHGDMAQPIIVGALWNGTDVPTYGNGKAAGKLTWAAFQGPHDAKKNDLRGFTSRKFHQLIFNDNSGDPRVALHSSQKHRIVLDDAGNKPTKIEIYDGKEENYILIDTANKKITIETKTGDMLFKAAKTIRLEAQTIETDSKANTTMKAGQNFEVKASANMKLNASASTEISASGNMKIKGAMVNIN